ncbi:hypothetical protein AVEN_142442-1 [Araneus ventricosus]|uniref:Uncharacterized protein n=1 Tax=Araneus ventricosus TaxID=182803 RepID=A0A4Y2MFU9_ARAVE|nr:hypothetical protein AVEN_142442-1 [Araneus ventricosus]
MPRACSHRCAIGNNALRGACGHRCLRCIEKHRTHGGKSEFPMLRKKRQYRHRNGDDCVTSIFFDASKIGTVLPGRPGRIFTNPTLIELRQEIRQYHWLRGEVTSFSALSRSVRQS